MIKLSKFSSIFIANWKLNGNTQFISEYYQKLLPNPKNCTVVCSPSIYLNRLKNNEKNLFSGAQDVSIYNEGAYTGEVSAKMLLNENIKFCIVGHSERRQFFNESNSVVKNKALHLIENKIIPVICIGETLKERQSKLTKSILSEQLQKSIPEIANYENSIIAYEPIWAIGTGLTPTLEEINDIHSFIKSTYSKFNQFNILYGGSVKSQNSVDIVSLENVNGCLIGGASLKVDEFNKIIS